MTTVQQVYEVMQRLAPPELAEHWDNPGLLVDCGGNVHRVLVTLDITPEVVAEAAAKQCTVIVAHHPVIFDPLKRLCPADVPYQLVQAGISAICMHTNLDVAPGGVNDALMVALGAEVTGGLEPSGTDDDGSALTCGRVGRLPEPMALSDFLPYVADLLHANGLRYVDGGRPVQKLAVCGGSGGSMLDLAAQMGCDTFVTADVKYDRFLAAKELGINLIDADHFCTENVIIPILCEKLRAQFPALTFAVSRVHAQTAQTYCP